LSFPPGTSPRQAVGNSSARYSLRCIVSSFNVIGVPSHSAWQALRQVREIFAASDSRGNSLAVIRAISPIFPERPAGANMRCSCPGCRKKRIFAFA
jgi:hypothetical protein